jgi:hypothetical protein
MGLSPIYFALLILGVQILLQQLENNFLVPRIIGGSLNLHPIVILVGAIVGASLAGITGLLLSAPVIASLRLFGRYVYRKVFDLDPWPEPPPPPASPPKFEWPRWLRAIRPKRRVQSPKSDPSGALRRVEGRTPEGRFAESEVQSQESEEQSSSGNG